MNIMNLHARECALLRVYSQAPLSYHFSFRLKMSCNTRIMVLPTHNIKKIKGSAHKKTVTSVIRVNEGMNMDLFFEFASPSS